MKYKKVYVKPAVPNTLVRDERTYKPLAQEGEWKPYNTYWVRRLRMKDVVECDPPKKVEVAVDEKPAKPSPAPKAKKSEGQK